MPSPDEIRVKIYAAIDELPTLPVVVPKLLGLMESDTSSAADIAGALSFDPPLSAKILKVANSAYYGFSRQITDLKTAVALLGFRMVRSLAISLGIIQTLPAGKKTSLFSPRGLWVHSVATGALVRELCARFGRRHEGDQLFTVGILHDVGKLVLNLFFHDPYEQALAEVRLRNRPELHDVEREMLGLDHGEVGALLLERWRLPEAVCRTIAAHHRSEIPEGPDGPHVALLRVANAVGQQAGPGTEGNPVPPELQARDMECLGLSAADVVAMRDYVATAGESIDAFFHAMS